MKRVALVINTLSSGGAERVVSNLSLVFPDEIQTDIILNDDTNISYPYKGRILSLGLPADADRMSLRYQLLLLTKRVRKLRKWKKENGYAAVISFSESANLANILSGKQGGKQILSVHNSLQFQTQAKRQYARSGALFMRTLYNRADRIVAVSREIADQMIRIRGIHPDLLCTIPNGVNFEQLPNQTKISGSDDTSVRGETSGPDDTVIRICSTGRLVPQKSHGHLLRVLAQLNKEGLHTHLTLLGSGPEETALKELAAELGLSEDISFPGYVSDPYQYMQQMDLAVCTSVHEGYANVLVEYQALGLPVISTDHHTGAREILAPHTDYRIKRTHGIEPAEYGILVPVCPGNGLNAKEPLTPQELDLAEAIRRLATDSDLREAYRNTSLNRQDIRMEYVIRKWIELINE